MHSISLFDILHETISRNSPTMWIFVLHWNHCHIFLSLRTWSPLMRFLAPDWKGRYCCSSRPVLLTLQHLSVWSPPKLQKRTWRSTALEGVIEVSLHIVDPHVMRFRRYPEVGINMHYVAITFQIFNWCWAVKWFTVVPQPILKFNKCTVYEYILIISEHQSTKLVSPASSTCKWNSSPNLGIPKYTDAFQSEVNLIRLDTLWIQSFLKWCISFDMGWSNGSSWQCWKCKSYTLQVFHWISALESRLKTLAVNIIPSVKGMMRQCLPHIFKTGTTVIVLHNLSNPIGFVERFIWLCHIANI